MELSGIREAPPGSADRFAFGANWRRFLAALDAERIDAAERTLAGMLGAARLDGRSFLDIGSGSGLMSLAARRLGARVTSFDYDAESVACTAELRRRLRPEDPDWTVRQGSVLDDGFVAALGCFDIVYSWGVLHHTGAMWRAIDIAAGAVAPVGTFYIAIYNDQGRATRRWAMLKRLYNRHPPLRLPLALLTLARQWGPTLLRDMLMGRPLRTWSGYAAASRGMSPWRDVVDWIGGWPFEAAAPDAVFDALRRRGFTLERLVTRCTGHGCNEFVFRRTDAQAAPVRTSPATDAPPA